MSTKRPLFDDAEHVCVHCGPCHLQGVEDHAVTTRSVQVENAESRLDADGETLESYLDLGQPVPEIQQAVQRSLGPSVGVCRTEEAPSRIEASPMIRDASSTSASRAPAWKCQWQDV